MAFVAMLLIKSFGYPIASGDIKLAGVAGIMTGHYAWAVIVLSWVLSAIIVWRERNPKGKAYPFGCSICVATIGVLIFQYLQ